MNGLHASGADETVRYIEVPASYVSPVVRDLAERHARACATELDLAERPQIVWCDDVSLVPSAVVRQFYSMRTIAGAMVHQRKRAVAGWVALPSGPVYVNLRQQLGELLKTISHECRHLAAVDAQRWERAIREKDAEAYAERAAPELAYPYSIVQPTYPDY
jgi:hypothetical protein